MTNEPMTVTRIRTTQGSHVEPPLDQAWSDRDKLRWHAAVAEHDSGVRVRLTNGSLSVGGRKVRDFYGLQVGDSLSMGGSFGAMWDYIKGVRDGAAVTTRSHGWAS